MRVIACLATTLDGKIASAKNLRARFGSANDLTHLLTVRNQADAILCGGETFRQHMGIRKGTQQSTTPPMQVILTRRFNLPPDAGLFIKSTQHTPAVPIVIVSPQAAPPEVRAQYPAHVEWLTTGDENPVPQVLDYLAKKGITTVSVEGGGHIVNLFLQAQALDEFYLTLCPLLLGGPDDPSLVSSPTGFSIAEAPRTEVLSAEWKGQELYLHLKMHYS
jgi:5-amino-6-(5-phosphoribosylamino)uracil reductase